MIRTFKQLLSVALSFLLVFTSAPLGAAAQQPAPAGSTGYSGQGTPLSADQLQQIVAPIALYPDALVAQILGAATFPEQVYGTPLSTRQLVLSLHAHLNYHLGQIDYLRRILTNGGAIDFVQL